MKTKNIPGFFYNENAQNFSKCNRLKNNCLECEFNEDICKTQCPTGFYKLEILDKKLLNILENKKVLKLNYFSCVQNCPEKYEKNNELKKCIKLGMEGLTKIYKDIDSFAKKNSTVKISKENVKEINHYIDRKELIL